MEAKGKEDRSTKISLVHNLNKEEKWMVYLTTSRWVPKFMVFPSVVLVHYKFYKSYSKLGVYKETEKKIENLIQVFNASNEDLDSVQRVAIVTGANVGIGYETARMLVRAGFQVILACRSEVKAKEAIQSIEMDSEPITEGRKGKAQFLELDLTSFQSVRTFVKKFLELNLPLHYLINNAGIMMVPKFELTIDNQELQFQVNHLSHFLLTDLLLPKLKSTLGITKIINLSSNAHYASKTKLDNFNCLNQKRNYKPQLQYCTTKLINILNTYKLQNTLLETNNHSHANGVLTYACHPGIVDTQLTRHLIQKESKSLQQFKQTNLKTPLQGALTTLRLVFLNQNQLDSDAEKAQCKQTRKDGDGKGRYHIYYQDELPISPHRLALDESIQDKLWQFSLKTVGQLE